MIDLPWRLKRRAVAAGWVMAAGLLIGCDNFAPAPVDFSFDDVVTVGEVATLDIRGTLVSSLPQAAPDVDTDRAELGRLLFWDPLLSGNRDTACATCHLPSMAYSDGLPRSIGTGGSGRGENREANGVMPVSRNAQHVVNAIWNGINEVGVFDPQQAPMFWDNRKQGLRQQAIEPLLAGLEMRGESFTEETILPEILARLNNNTEYRELFQQTYDVATIDTTVLADALASFQSSLIAAQTPFDRWMRGDATAMTTQQVSGMQEFVIAGCAECHSGPLFSDFELHVLGSPEAEGLAEADVGDGNFGFRTPSLRQLRFTAPYFHGGQFASLAAVLDFYDEPEDHFLPNSQSTLNSLFQIFRP
ncbi:MAG: cytochrome-c peroxidase [Pseudomonadota bacterium]